MAQIDAHRAALAEALRDIGVVGLTLYGLLCWLVTDFWLPVAAGATSLVLLSLLTAAFRLFTTRNRHVLMFRISAEYIFALLPLFAVSFLSVADLPDSFQLFILFMLAVATSIAVKSARYLPQGPRTLAVAGAVGLIAICVAMAAPNMWVAAAGLLLMICLIALVAEHGSGDLAERLLSGERGRAAQLSLEDYEEQAADRLFRIDDTGLLRDVGPRLARLASRRAEDLEGAAFRTLFTSSEARDELAKLLDKGLEFADLIVPIDVRGDARLWSVSARPSADKSMSGMRGVVSDVTARRSAEARISRLAHYDPLTDLPNRLTLEKRAKTVLEAASVTSPCALLFLDVDQFKSVNDDLGHQAGDVVLREIAMRLRKLVPDDSIVARMGGDEFAILLSVGADPSSVTQLSGRIVDAISVPISHDGLSVQTSISLGAAVANSQNIELTDLLHHADLALYSAKEQGRNRWQLYDPKMGASARQRHELVAEMAIALKQNQFELYYQPLVDARTQDVRGFEALIRWTHPVKGFMSPADFIPAAEESGFIKELGKWVIETAVTEAASWPGNLTVAVNVSPIQLTTDGLEHVIAEALRSAGLQPPRLEVEITESVLLQESKRIRALLERVRSLGVRFSLDDFGTGFSSLSYLRTFSFHKIKIDRSFVIDMQSDKNCLAIIKTVISLARDMGMTTVAEGIELPGQLAALQGLGCDQIQGYLTGRPMPAADVHKLLNITPQPQFRSRRQGI